jgi:hypothetical protein
MLIRCAPRRLSAGLGGRGNVYVEMKTDGNRHIHINCLTFGLLPPKLRGGNQHQIAVARGLTGVQAVSKQTAVPDGAAIALSGKTRPVHSWVARGRDRLPLNFSGGFRKPFGDDDQSRDELGGVDRLCQTILIPGKHGAGSILHPGVRG